MSGKPGDVQLPTICTESKSVQHPLSFSEILHFFDSVDYINLQCPEEQYKRGNRSEGVLSLIES